PWDTQKWPRHICDRAYKNSVEGSVGNEDVGQISAWYVLASSGLHPSCPGSTRFEITSPLFDEVEFRLDNDYYSGKHFTIKAHHNTAKNMYVQKALLNGNPYDKCFIDFQEIAAGGKL